MATLIKLTNVDYLTQSDTPWGPGVTNTAGDPKRRAELCSSAVVHAYRTVPQALLMNGMHAGYLPPVIWEARGIVKVDDATKVGCRRLTTVWLLDTPTWYTNPAQRSLWITLTSTLLVRAMVDAMDSALFLNTERQQVRDYLNDIQERLLDRDVYGVARLTHSPKESPFPLSSVLAILRDCTRDDNVLDNGGRIANRVRSFLLNPEDAKDFSNVSGHPQGRCVIDAAQTALDLLGLQG